MKIYTEIETRMVIQYTRCLQPPYPAYDCMTILQYNAYDCTAGCFGDQPVCLVLHRQPGSYNLCYHASKSFHVNASVLYSIRNHIYIVTIDLFNEIEHAMFVFTNEHHVFLLLPSNGWVCNYTVRLLNVQTTKFALRADTSQSFETLELILSHLVQKRNIFYSCTIMLKKSGTRNRHKTKLKTNSLDVKETESVRY